ncbi:CoF synthetase [Paenibacillus koleovorans]|uniref:CoF synthetase n=1 Tax=Paenibacillus koleovorans TaxID=121608 RepID=UPI001FE3CB61|nr:CoF synthetase [Paenibacillus koleovorans]
MSGWLSDLLERRREQFPWYEEWSARRGVTIGETSTLEELPLITAPVLEAYYYTDSNPLAGQEGLNRYRTSGTSSGRRKTIFYSPADEEAYLRVKLDVYRTILGGEDGITIPYRTALSDVGTGHAEATAVAVFRELGMEVRSLSFQEPIERHIERLVAFRPEVLYTMPSILERILLASPETASAYGIRHVILVGEIASPGWMQRAAERLGITADNITDTYGSIEIGTIAYLDHRLGRYLFTEGIVAEGIGAEQISWEFDRLTDPLEQVLVLTSTVRETFPALRFVTYDVVRDLRPVEVDGVQRMSFQSIAKRIGAELKHGEKISLYDIEEAVFRHVEGAHIRVVVQGRALGVHVDVPGARLEPALLERIRDEIEHRIPEIGMMIRAGILDRIRLYSGKIDDTQFHGAVKSKKIIYGLKEGSE